MPKSRYLGPTLGSPTTWKWIRIVFLSLLFAALAVDFYFLEAASLIIGAFIGIGVLLYFMDLARWQKIEGRLRISNRLLEDAQRIAHLGIWELELAETEINKNPLRWSNEVFRIFGYPPNAVEVSNDLFFSHVPKEEWPKIQTAIKKSIEEGGPYEVEHRVVRHDGDIRIVREKGEVLRDENKKPIRVLGTLLDITEKKQAEEHLQASEAALRATFQGVGVGLAHVTRDGRFIMVNQRYSEILGYSVEELLQLKFKDITHPEDVGTDVQLGEKLWNKEIPPFKVEKRYVRKDGQVVWVLLTVSTFNNAQGEPLYFISSGQDITPMKKASEEAEKANQAKSQFLAQMSHEIRTPLNAILGFSELLIEGNLKTDEQQSFLHRIRASGDHLLNVIDDILDLSKFEAGEIPIEKSQFSVGKLIEELIGSMRPQFDKKDLDVRYTASPNMPAKIETDQLRVRQILNNLLSNAIKFTDKGRVQLRLEFLPENGKISIEVEDTGIGIPLSQQTKIFRPFAQADSSITRRFGGTGLGLVLSRRLASALGGDLSLKFSQPGKGTCFLLTFDAGNISASHPVKDHTNSAQTSQTEQSPAELKGVKVLLAEDSPDGALLVKRYLEKAGANVYHVTDGLGALQATHEKKFDVVLMDIQMPHMDGLEATGRLRSEGYAKPILALTAHALRSEVDRSLKAGCNAHLTKPVRRQELIQAIKESLH